MKFAREEALRQQALDAYHQATVLLEKRALPVIDAFLRVGRKDDAMKFAQTLPLIGVKQRMIDHIRYGVPKP